MPPKDIIALTGYRRSGKDTVADILAADYGYSKLAFADPLKEIAGVIGWDGTKTEGQTCDHCGMPQGRLLLQLLGTEGMRDNLWQGVFVDAMTRRLDETSDPVVITDCRFPNEAALVKARGGEVWRVHRPSSEVGDHSTETSVDEIVADRRIFNDGELEDLLTKVRGCMK